MAGLVLKGSKYILFVILTVASSCNKKEADCNFVNNLPDIIVVRVIDEGSTCLLGTASVRIDAPVDTAATYIWSPGGETSSSITVDSVAIYTVKVITMTDTAIYEKEVVLSCGYFSPSSFSPNGDGINDDFGLVGIGIGCFYMEIHNTDGILMYSTSEVGARWNGQRNNKGVTLPIGLYPYHMEFLTEEEGSMHVFDGRVYLIE